MRHGQALCTLLLAASLAHADEEQPALRFDPFAVPELSGLPTSQRPKTGPEPRGHWEPVLRATLVAGEESLADLGGVLLAIGEETHGYRLLEVAEFEAVFAHGEERVVLALPGAGEESP